MHLKTRFHLVMEVNKQAYHIMASVVTLGLFYTNNLHMARLGRLYMHKHVTGAFKKACIINVLLNNGHIIGQLDPGGKYELS